MLSGTSPIKLPMPQEGSSTLPVWKCIFSKALYTALITTGGV